MKPLNNNTVRKGYLRFSGFLIICVAVSVFCFYSYMKTASTEVKMIMSKTVEYDNIYSTELSMAVAVDSIYQYMALMNSSPKINDASAAKCGQQPEDAVAEQNQCVG